MIFDIFFYNSNNYYTLSDERAILSSIYMYIYILNNILLCELYIQVIASCENI